MFSCIRIKLWFPRQGKLNVISSQENNYVRIMTMVIVGFLHYQDVWILNTSFDVSFRLQNNKIKLKYWLASVAGPADNWQILFTNDKISWSKVAFSIEFVVYTFSSEIVQKYPINQCWITTNALARGYFLLSIFSTSAACSLLLKCSKTNAQFNEFPFIKEIRVEE